jgi:hypothetical protein
MAGTAKKSSRFAAESGLPTRVVEAPRLTISGLERGLEQVRAFDPGGSRLGTDRGRMGTFAFPKIPFLAVSRSYESAFHHR